TSFAPASPSWLSRNVRSIEADYYSAFRQSEISELSSLFDLDQSDTTVVNDVPSQFEDSPVPALLLPPSRSSPPALHPPLPHPPRLQVTPSTPATSLVISEARNTSSPSSDATKAPASTTPFPIRKTSSNTSAPPLSSTSCKPSTSFPHFRKFSGHR